MTGRESARAFFALLRRARARGGPVGEFEVRERFEREGWNARPIAEWPELLAAIDPIAEFSPAARPAKEREMTTPLETLTAMLDQLPADLRQAVVAAFSAPAAAAGTPTPVPAPVPPPAPAAAGTVTMSAARRRHLLSLSQFGRDVLADEGAGDVVSFSGAAPHAAMTADRRRQLLGMSEAGRDVLAVEAAGLPATFAARGETPLQTITRQVAELAEQLEREQFASDPHADTTAKQLTELKQQQAAIEHGLWQLGRPQQLSGVSPERRRELLKQSPLGQAILASADPPARK